ncbi:MAG: KOW domain-containing RNA-binding protein [Clostridia bacterium]|nr:KOW domain-containing RNA-binding protein [Clostridia bacterium]
MSNDFIIGQVVISTRGRDKGNEFIVIEKDEQYVYLVDGDLRKIETPKKKKMKHVEKTTKIILEIQKMINKGTNITNSKIKKMLKSYEDLKEGLNVSE